MGATKVAKRISIKYKKVARHWYRKKRKASTPHLPDDLIFHILVKLPADILFNAVRYVCKQWYNVIKDPLFIRAQLLVCHTASLLVKCYQENTAYLVPLTQKKGTLTELVTFPSCTEIISVCDGLILFHYKMTGTMHVANPLTKQIFTLPQIDAIPKKPIYSLGRVRSTMEYKVVFTCYCMQKHQLCGVITLGIDDSWRILDTSWFFALAYEAFFRQPLIVGNFLHWICYGYIITFHLELERLYISHRPKFELRDNPESTTFVARGESLTCLMGFYKSTLWDVWVSLDNIGRRWKKLHVIDFGPQKQQLRRMVKGLFRVHDYFQTGLRPVAWIDDGKLVVFRAGCEPYPFVAYNIETGCTSLLPCHGDNCCHDFIQIFTPSLLALS